MKKIRKQAITTKIFIPLLLISLTLLFSLTAVSAANDSIYVNTTGNDTIGNGSIDNPYLTIQKGIDNLNPNGTINIANGQYSGTGNTNISINKNMALIGESQNGTIINGENTNWIFNISSGVNVSIQNLTLANGYSNQSGGAIYNLGTLNVTSSTFTNNTVNNTNSGPYGFEVYGGAIFNLGTLNVTNSTFNNNTVNNIYWGMAMGGAICNNGALTVTNSTFTGNTANCKRVWGGAICNNGVLTVTGSIFTNNTANSTVEALGGAICNNNDLTVTSCTFTGNTANGKLPVQGGAICNSGNLFVPITDSTFTGNAVNGQSSCYGGAICGFSNITNCTFTNNTANVANGPYGSGGAIAYCGNTITDCTFIQNSATNGGAIDNEYGTLTVTGSIFIQNSATNGGAIYNQKSTFIITGSTFTGNTAENGDGGAIFNYDNVATNITNCTFTGNQAIWNGIDGHYDGGAIYNYADGNLESINNGIMNVIINNSIFTGNTVSTGGSGGAIANIAFGPGVGEFTFINVDITNSTFTDNFAAGRGNTIANYPVPWFQNPPPAWGSITVTITNSTFSSAWANGGILNYHWPGANIAVNIIGSTLNGVSIGSVTYDWDNIVVNIIDSTLNGGYIGSMTDSEISNLAVNIIDNTLNGVQIQIANNGGSNTFNVNFNRIINGTQITNDVGTVNAENNWWGSNNPSWPSLIYGFANPSSWVILSVNSTPNTIDNGGTSTITADLNHINGGGPLTGGQIPDGIPVTFTLDPSWGSITDINPASSTTLNGQIEATYRANGILPVQTPMKVYANVDDEHTVYAEINIKKPTTITFNSPHGYNGNTVDITATLTETGTTTGIANEPITITVNGQTYAGITNGSGQVTWPYFINNMIPQDYTITANFLGDSQYEAANGQGILTVDPPADITVTKVVNPGNANTNVGHSFNYTITASNIGPGTATGVQVTDLIPTDLTFNNYTTNQGTYNSITGIWDIGTIINGATAWLNLNVTIKPSTAGKTIANTATKTHENELDPTTTDDTSTSYIYVPQADIGINKYTSKSNVSIGEVFYYTIAVNNAGPDAATGVQITDLTPSTLNFLSYDTHGTGTYNPTTGIWNIGTIGNGMTDYLTIYASPKASAAGTTITNTATKTAENEYSSIPGVGSVNIHVIMADISVNKIISNPNPNVGDTFNYTITATNNGTDTATGLTVYDFISGVLTVNSINTSQGIYDPATRLWTIGSLANGATASMIINVTVKTSAAGHYIVNTAYKYTEDQYDPTTAEDTSTINTYVNPQTWTVTISQLETAATYVKAYYETHNSTLPINIKIGYDTVSMPQFLQLLVTGTLNINNGNLNPINVTNVNNPTSPSGNNAPGSLQKPEYLTVASSIKNYINTNGKAPNYMSTSLGNINYTKLVYIYSKIVNFYQINTRLPNYVTI